MKSFLIGATGLALFLGATLPTEANTGGNCAPRDAVIERLASGYGETRQSIGLAPNNQVVEVFASTQTGTWTITVTTPAGLTCLVATGEAYQPLAETLAAEGDDA